MAKMKIDEDKLLSFVKTDIQNAEQFYEGNIQPKLVERYQLYNADPNYYANKFKRLSKRSNIVMSDIADTIEWAMPSLMRIFFGGQDVVTIWGRTEEDDEKAELMQELINFQLQRQNPGFMLFYRWFKDALIGGLGIVKCYWERDWDEYEKEIVLGEDEVALAQEDPATEISDITDLGNGLFKVKLKIKKVTKNQPKVENVPASEFIYHPDALNIEDSPFVAHRKRVSVDYLLRKEKEGVYKNVKQVIESINDDEVTSFKELDYFLKPYKQDLPTQEVDDEARKQVVLYECYTRYDINGDGLLEDVIITVAGNTILRVQENVYGRPPFFVLTPMLEPYQIWGKGFADVLKDLQDIKTALVNQIIVNIAMNNDFKLAVNEILVNIDDYIQDKPIIRVKANADIRQAIMPLQITPLAPWSFNFLEYIEEAKQNRTGITKYTQGLDARSLNKRIDINTPVPMADGTWKLLKDIQDGDLILGGDGKPTKVIKAHEIALCEDSYKLTFSNGAEIYADGEHLWGVFVYDRYHVLTTKEVYEKVKKGKPVYVPRPERICSGQEKELPIDPYIFGVWLGDGHKYSSRITTEDKEIVERLKEYCKKEGWKLSEDKHQNSGKAKTYLITSVKERKRDENGRFIKEDSFFRRLKDLGVSKVNGGEPHIPAEYFTASYEQRLELLRGLMDTDGCWGSNGIAIFSTSNYRLAEDVAKLARSLGGNPHITKSRKKGKDIICGVECNVKDHYQVRFNLFDCPFYIPRKANKWKPPTKQKTYRIVDVEPAEPRYMRCLTVDNPDGLWLVGEHYITTHNTATGISMIMQAANQRLELIARIFAETGVKDLFRFLVELNQRFIDQRQVVRLTNKQLIISPDDLTGQFDLQVNAGIGVGTKEMTIANLQMLLSLYPQLLQMGLATPEHVYNAVKKLIEEMGFKNVNDFLQDPQQAMQLAQQMQMMGGINGGGQGGAISPPNGAVPPGLTG